MLPERRSIVFCIVIFCLMWAGITDASAQQAEDEQNVGLDADIDRAHIDEPARPDLSFLSDTTTYLWPTSASPYISSTFGETRTRHFHAGLDIRTWGREGYPVYATRDGVVHRLTIAPDGYGIAVYLQHDDGSYSIYAHLNRFEESLMAYADSIRMKDYSFRFDRLLGEKKIRVKQGDLIGFTGSTGIGPPHLHFELRTPENIPFNPLRTSLEITDDIPPYFSGLAVEHLDPENFHRKRLETRSVSGSGEELDFGSIHTEGPFGLAVNVHDRANRTPNHYAVYRLLLIHEQDTLFTSTKDAFSYTDASQMFVDRVFDILRERRDGYQRLYLVNGNTLPFYETGPTRGVIDLPEGGHRLTIVAEDYYGNRSSGTLAVEVQNRSKDPAEKILSIPAYPRLKFDANPRQVAIRPGPRSAFLVRTDGTILPPQPGPAEEPAPVLVHRKEGAGSNQAGRTLYPGKRQILPTPDQTLWLDIPKDALFDTLNVEVILDDQGPLPKIRFQPERIPLKRPVRLNLILPDSLSANHDYIGFYGYDTSRDRYLFLENAEAGTVNRLELHELGPIAVMNDPAPPWVGRPVLERNLGEMYVVQVPAVDQRSGIDYSRSSVIVNGESGITEYDPEKHRLTFYKPGFEPQEENRVEVTAYNRAGNRIVRSFTIQKQ